MMGFGMRFRALASVVGVLLSVMAFNAVAATQVKSVRLWRAPDNTRLVFDLTGPVQHKDLRVGGCQLVRKRPRAVGRVVIDDENVCLRHAGTQSRHDPGQGFAFVVGRNHDERSHLGRLSGLACRGDQRPHRH